MQDLFQENELSHASVSKQALSAMGLYGQADLERLPSGQEREQVELERVQERGAAQRRPHALCSSAARLLQSRQAFLRRLFQQAAAAQTRCCPSWKVQAGRHAAGTS